MIKTFSDYLEICISLCRSLNTSLWKMYLCVLHSKQDYNYGVFLYEARWISVLMFFLLFMLYISWS